MNQVAMGIITGNASTQLIALGFTPEYVQVRNVADGISHTWDETMSNDTAMKQALLSYQKITSEGITPIRNSTTDGVKDGFQIGVTISATGKVLHWTAFRNGPGFQSPVGTN